MMNPFKQFCWRFQLNDFSSAGRSMGSRAAVMTANQTREPVIHGIICLAYPLQKTPDDVSDDRENPLKDLEYPALLISGTEDEMMSQTRINHIIKQNDKLEIFWVDGVGHSLQKKKKDMDSVTLVNETVSGWCKKILRSVADDCGSVNYGIGGMKPASAKLSSSEKKRKVNSDTSSLEKKHGKRKR
jgi:predicted alpha/beta-hydrolase family hydrolase